MKMGRVFGLLLVVTLVLTMAGCGIFGDTPRKKIQYDNDGLGGGFGVTSADDVLTEAAICLTVAKLTPYDGKKIVGVEFYNCTYVDRDFTVRLYQGTTSSAPTEPAVREATITRNVGYWVALFDEPYTIDIDQGDIWVSCATLTKTNTQPIGYDNSPIPDPNGRYYRAGGGSWSTASDIGNFIIRAVY